MNNLCYSIPKYHVSSGKIHGLWSEDPKGGRGLTKQSLDLLGRPYHHLFYPLEEQKSKNIAQTIRIYMLLLSSHIHQAEEIRYKFDPLQCCFQKQFHWLVVGLSCAYSTDIPYCSAYFEFWLLCVHNLASC